MTPDRCLCSHGRDRHDQNGAGPHRGKCLAPLCGCLWFRLGPSLGDEAETWLAGREPEGKDAPREGAA